MRSLSLRLDFLPVLLREEIAERDQRVPVRLDVRDDLALHLVELDVLAREAPAALRIGENAIV